MSAIARNLPFRYLHLGTLVVGPSPATLVAAPPSPGKASCSGKTGEELTSQHRSYFPTAFHWSNRPRVRRPSLAETPSRETPCSVCEPDFIKGLVFRTAVTRTILRAKCPTSSTSNAPQSDDLTTLAICHLHFTQQGFANA
jgi:hypothetical protein